ncbi:MAG: hypothetical protein QF745_07465, partial [Planctomycetota bacterium]|nr:hypothetical protein [Planctomycetota bacterium]
MLKGIFVGYKLNPGGAWGGEYLVFDKEAFIATAQGKWCKEHTTKEIYLPGESADDAAQLTFPVREGRWKQMPGNVGIKRYFKPKRKPAEGDKPPQHEGEDADDEAIDADETEPMWGDEALAALDGEEGEQDDQTVRQETLSGSDDPAAEEPGGNEPPILKDYWEQRGLYLYRVHVVPRTMRFAPTLCDEEPPIPLVNIEVYRATIPDKFYQIPQEEDTWIGHKKDEQVFRRNANGSPLSWTGETRFERVLTTGTWKQGRFDWVMVRPGNPARFQAGRYSRRTPDTSVEVWNAYSELQKLEDIVDYDKVRAPRYAHARANRTLPRETYQDPLVPLL